jgi:hypothetical protein
LRARRRRRSLAVDLRCILGVPGLVLEPVDEVRIEEAGNLRKAPGLESLVSPRPRAYVEVRSAEANLRFTFGAVLLLWDEIPNILNALQLFFPGALQLHELVHDAEALLVAAQLQCLAPVVDRSH